MRFSVCSWFVGLVMLAALPFSVQAERRIALVVGNSAYQHGETLLNPGRDAESMAKRLRELGFSDVWVEQDIGRDDLRMKLIDFGDQAKSADWALIYFSGHGIEIGGTNYVVPVDARLERDTDIRLEAVPLYEIVEAVGAANELRLVILDASRGNPFLDSMKVSRGAIHGVGSGLGRIEPKKGTLVASAARDGQLAIDSGEGDNGIYVSALLQYIGTPGLGVPLMFQRVRESVKQRTGGEQEPATYGSLSNNSLQFVSAFRTAVKVPALPLGGQATEVMTDADVIKEVQRRLFELNYDPGPADGVMGGQTAEAIRELQSDLRLPIDGRASKALLSRLRAADSLSPWGAIVFAPSSAKWGMSWGADSRAEAIQIAQKSCGGVCDKELTFFNGWCGAFAYASKGWGLSSRDSIGEAKNQALAGCKQQMSGCEIFAAVCADGTEKYVPSN